MEKSAKEALARATQEKADAESAYEQAKKEFPDAEKIISDDTKAVEKAQDKKKEAEAKVQTAKSLVDELQNKLDKAKDKEADSKKLTETTAQDVKTATHAVADAQKAVDDAQKALDAVGDASPEYKNAKKALDDAEIELSNAEDALKIAQKEKESADALVTEKENVLTGLNFQKEAYEAVHRTLEQKVEEAKLVQKNANDKYNEAKNTEELTNKSFIDADEANKKATENLTIANIELNEAKEKLKTVTDEAKTANDAVEKAKQDLEKAKTSAKLTKEEIDAAKEQWNKGSVAFFENNKSTNALSVFTTEKNTRNGKSYLDPTRNAGENDSRNLDRMKLSIDQISIINAKRQKDGGIDGRKLATLGINDYCMAVAQANANYSSNQIEHAVVYQPPYENLYWGGRPSAESALIGWWDEEKETFDFLRTQKGLTSRTEMDKWLQAHPDEVKNNNLSTSVGHYTNLVDDLMWGSGYGANDRIVAGYSIRPGLYGHVQSLQLSHVKTGETFSIEDYKTKFDKYYNDLKARTEGINPDAQADIDKAQNALDAANKDKEEKAESLKMAESDFNKKQNNVGEAQKNWMKLI